MNVPFVLFYANFVMFGHAFFGNEFICMYFLHMVKLECIIEFITDE